MGWIDDQLAKGEFLTAKLFQEKFGFNYVMGVCFYGQKALVGPVCVTAVILRPNYKFVLKPANKLSQTECMELNKIIRRKCDTVRIAWINESDINSIGYQHAAMMALNQCLVGISRFDPLSLLFIDSFQPERLPNGIADSNTPMYVVKKGREKLDCIMAASVVARVARETAMSYLHKTYPEYEWATNEGFATPRHIELIKQFGISPVHHDLSNVKALQNWKVFVNERWKKAYENNLYSE